MSLLLDLFDSNEKQIKQLRPLVDAVNSFSESTMKLSETQIKEKTLYWKEALKKLDEEKRNDYLNEILPEAFAVAREAASRTIQQRHFDVQIMAGIVLHRGMIAEQKTGEGKTLTATLPLYLNALTGEGSHLVTPNDYLSRHGAGWMGPVYNQLGISVGVVMEDVSLVYDPAFEGQAFQDEYAVHLRPASKLEAYRCDVTYGTNHTFGFDYLRDNMAFQLGEMAQTNPNGGWGVHNFAIVDEVDSILIDVAKTPLIISAPASTPSDRYHQAIDIVKSLTKKTDYEIDEKFRTATLTDLGVRKVEKLLGNFNLYEQDFEMVHLLEQSLVANTLYEKDRDYVIKEGRVVIIDQSTGRLLPNNRYSQGLHQAIEAKENVGIQQESRTLAEISYQNYFRMYKKLSGMTGTATTEDEEFNKIYNLDVVSIPTNRPNVRVDHNDMVYKTESAKFRAVVGEIAQLYQKGQPILIGTTSVEKSQTIHDLLQRRGISHEILNAKNHEREALIIAQAGKKGAVTVSTNMAGRGVDIILGGDPPDPKEQEEVKSLGGLHIIGTERHDSRRIDNQLRGRSGRQGDPGASRFYLSLQDDLMRIFGGQQVENLMTRFKLDENVPLEAGIVSHAIETAQKKVEGFNFDRRKYTVEMDDVMNVHRKVLYGLRRRFLTFADDLSEKADDEEWILAKLAQYRSADIQKEWDGQKRRFGEEVWRKVVWTASQPVIDLMWMEHLVDMDRIRDGIGLRGYAQRDPMVEYKREGHARFELLIDKVYAAITDRLFRVESVDASREHRRTSRRSLAYSEDAYAPGVSDEAATSASPVTPVKSAADKVGRNDPCPCGSGKKFKKCHGK